MIDLERMDEQLERAVVVAPLLSRPARVTVERAGSAPREPRPATRAAHPHRPRAVDDLLEQGLFEEAYEAIAAHAHRAPASPSAADRLDAAAWATMQAVLAGRRDDALAAHATVRSLVDEIGSQELADRAWVQRFWLAFHWAGDDERYIVLDHCRERAYRFDELAWYGALSVLLADMGKQDEALRAFDSAVHHLDTATSDRAWLDVATNLAEAAALLGDRARAGLVHRRLSTVRTPVVVVGQGWVCKGPVDRFVALSAAVGGRWAEADDAFHAAALVARQAGADAVLARTLQQWGHSLLHRDDLRATACLREAGDLAQRLGLSTGMASPGKVA